MELRTLKRGDKYLRGYDTTGAALYIRLVLELDGRIWDTAAAALSLTTALADSDVAMTEKDRVWSVAIPATLPIGVYLVSTCVMAGAAPADTDEVLGTERINIAS